MVIWEYEKLYTDSSDFRKEANALGEKGWELVKLSECNYGPGKPAGFVRLIAFFKRPKETQNEIEVRDGIEFRRCSSCAQVIEFGVQGQAVHRKRRCPKCGTLNDNCE